MRSTEEFTATLQGGGNKSNSEGVHVSSKEQIVAINEAEVAHVDERQTRPAPEVASSGSEAVRAARQRLPDKRRAITHHFSIAGQEGALAPFFPGAMRDFSSSTLSWGKSLAVARVRLVERANVHSNKDIRVHHRDTAVSAVDRTPS